MFRSTWAIACLTLAPAPAVLAQRAAQTPGVELSFTLRPIRAGAPEVSAVDVRGEIRGRLTRPLTLRVPVSHAFRKGIADRVDSLVVRDASGLVPVRVETEPENKSGYTYYRRWRAERTVVPPVEYRYRMRPQPRPSGGPVYEFYAHNGGLSTGGVQLFVLPESAGVTTTRVRWDLSDLDAESFAVGTWGQGDFDIKGNPELPLTESFYMAGRISHFEPPNNRSNFHAYWLGTPTWSPQKEAAWAHQVYEYLRTFYRDTISSYRVFIRMGGGGGTAHYNSFMTGAQLGKGDSSVAGPRPTIAHEMGHYFVGWLSDAPLGSDLWYGDGLNEHYTRLLLLRSGLGPVSGYLDHLNSHARAYYTNPYRNASNDSLQRLGYSTGFGVGSAQNLAYNKGSLFWGELDSRIRNASGGRRKLDDVVLPMFERRRQGQKLTLTVLADAIEKELGPPGRQFFDAVILRGETLVPASNAFGPCFGRQATKYEFNGTTVDGYLWARVPGIPDERCRLW